MSCTGMLPSWISPLRTRNTQYIFRTPDTMHVLCLTIRNSDISYDYVHLRNFARPSSWYRHHGWSRKSIQNFVAGYATRMVVFTYSCFLDDDYLRVGRSEYSIVCRYILNLQDSDWEIAYPPLPPNWLPFCIQHQKGKNTAPLAKRHPFFWQKQTFRTFKC